MRFILVKMPMLPIQSLLFIFILHLCSYTTAGEYSYLIDGQNALHIKSLEPLAFSRRNFNDIWIYKNGFVSIGNAIENENYPNLIDGTVQPFESIVGHNIIAVFIMEYQMISDSMVRVRQHYINTIDTATLKLIKSIEVKIKKVHGEFVKTPLKRIVEVEWINVKPAGVNGNKKNTFRLFILSNRNQSFCVIHYVKVQSSIYKLNGKTFPYQSGLSSQTEMKFILPLYNVTRTNNLLQDSSNIGLENFWVIAMGDISYNIDFGWSPQNNINLESSSTNNEVTKSQKELRRTNQIEPNKYRSSSGSFGMFKSHTRSPSSTEVPITSSLSANHNQRTSSKRPIGAVEKTYKSNRQLSTIPSKDIKMTTRLTAQYPIKPKHLSLKFDWYNSKNVPTNKHLMDEGAITRRPPTRTACSNITTCKFNEECFRFNEKSCCKCRPGTHLIERKCIKNDDPFYGKSQGIARMSSVGLMWNFDLTLLISKGSFGNNENFPRAHITLMLYDELALEIRNFLLLLYPLFHIPMAFYAIAWKNETAENMNALVEQMAGIHIYLAVGNYDQIYISFRLDRQQNDDIWNVSINGFDIKKLKDLNLSNLRFDEKSPDSFNLVYNLINSNSIEFPEQVVQFQDESNSKHITIKWRGTMSFAATCLANYLGNKMYYVKFSDKSYCNSDCYLESEGKKNCRVMCLGSPHVFDRLPKSCDGNFCGQNQICVNSQEKYECKCDEGMIEFEGKCINGDQSLSTKYSTGKSSKKQKECEKCSSNANCVSINLIECCSCKIRYIGSGINCWEKDSQFELRVSGKMNIGAESISGSNSEKIINLLFRQYRSEDGLHLASFLGLEQFQYMTSSDQQLLHFVLLLAPLFDIPLALFASGTNQSKMENIYALSNGQTKIEIEIESTVFAPMNITMEFMEGPDNVQMAVKVRGIPIHLNPSWLIDSFEHFITRGGIGGDIKYSIEGNRITFARHKIKLPEKVNSYEMSWKGTGELHKCANYEPKRNFLVVSTNQFDCNPKCQDNICKPYCQATTVLHELPTETFCLTACKATENCIKGTCVCNPGYSRQNSHCEPIKKHLECRHSSDCYAKRFTECKNNKCLCQAGFEFRVNECVKNSCQFCGTNEQCVNGACGCKSGFVLNRISQQCVFDCSVCDPYSTHCIGSKCSCSAGFTPRYNDTKHCDMNCDTDNDCPTHERCTKSKVCQCPYDKSNGVCRQTNGCDNCHGNAFCHDDICKCQPEWVGNGITCTYNCSLCFDKKHCSPKKGCSCPPKFIGDGKSCRQTDCIEECPENSACIEENKRYHCKCSERHFKVGNKCVHDPVELNIFPLASQIEVNEGETVELFCMGSSQISKFHLFWLRNSGRPLNGQFEYADLTNTTLKLSLKPAKVEDSDRYVCGTESGSRKYINIQVNKITGPSSMVPNCQGQCSNFARCENGQCKCLGKYVGNGIDCCTRLCSSYEICNKTLGQCLCRSGFTIYKSKCVKDCRKYHHCDRNAKCSPEEGICKCNKHFIGNGTTCWKQSNNCLLTRRCAPNASCKIIDDIKQHLCLCDPGFVGDGTLYCYPIIDCGIHKCERNSFCEPFMVQDEFGSHVLNGKCSCEPGYSFIDNHCAIKREKRITLWMSMGESIISRKIDQNISVIQYIEIAKNNEVTGIITSMASDCVRERLVWAADNGKSLKSASNANFSNISTHLSNLGKIIGIAIDETTGNVYYADNYRGKIGLLNLDRNISKTIVSMDNYSPGPIVAHHPSRKIFWVVNDYSNPRIEVAEFNGKNHKVFLTMKVKAISLAIAFQNNSFDNLCWVEVIKDLQSRAFPVAGSSFGIIKCVSINNPFSQPTIRHKIRQEEPFSALMYVDKAFYWNVKQGAMLRTLRNEESQIYIHPNCCDVRVSSLTAIDSNCPIRNSIKDPCYNSLDKYKCPDLCVPVYNNKNVLQTVCLDKEK